MKKLILAPAVALAFSGLVAAPVAAAEAPSTQSDTAKTEAEQAKKEKVEQKKAEEEAEAAAEKKAAEKKVAEEEAAEKKVAAKKAAEEEGAADKAAEKKADEKSGDDAKDSEKPAPKDEDSDDSKKDDAENEDANEDATEKLNASLQLSTQSVNAEDLADDGLRVTVSNLEEGDKLSVNGGDLTAGSTTASSSTETLVLHTDDEAEDIPATQRVSLKVQREGVSAQSLTSSVTVTALADADIDPKVSVGESEISEADFKKNGVEFSGEGFGPDSEVVVSGGSPQAAFFAEDVTTDEDGKFSVAVTSDNELEPGEYEVRAVAADDADVSASTTFTITEDDDAVDPIVASLKVNPKEITAEDLSNKDKGVTVTVSGVKKGDEVTDSLTDEAETADADGDYKLHLYYQGNPDSLEEGKVAFSVTIDREGTESQTLNGNINVVVEDNEDGDDGDHMDGGDSPEAPAEASFTVSPKTMEAADFINEKKGAHLSVENCEPGSDVHFNVKPKGINVSAYDNTVTADDEGKASVSVYGTSTNASAYVGSYTASATCGEDTMNGSFTVTAGAEGGGSDGDDGNGNDGSQLPRTGADLDGLASGAMLLLVGGAAIAMTGRRKKVGQSPSDF